jgi:hypothetical protein
MIRALMTLLFVGFLGFVALGIVTSLAVPLLALAVKIAVVLFVGYLILNLVAPDRAEEVRSHLGGE